MRSKESFRSTIPLRNISRTHAQPGTQSPSAISSHNTSGSKDDYWQLYRGSPLVNYGEKDIYAYATGQPLLFKPGERYAYNDEGYYLLGLIISKSAGEPYTKWIAEHVLKPAGMITARIYDPWAVVPHMVSSYALKDGRDERRGDPDMRAQTKQLLAGMSGFAYLACAKASLKDPYGAVLYCYYRTKIPPGNLDLGFGLTPGGQLASAMGQPD